MHGFTTRVAGSSFRQIAIEQCRAGDDVELIREPGNKHDKNAVRVDSDYGQIGYLPASAASVIAPQMDEGETFDAFIKKTTGGTDDKPTRGVVIHIRAFSDVVSDLAAAEGDDEEISWPLIAVFVLGGISLIFAVMC